MTIPPMFRIVPVPKGFIILTVTGRRSSKPHHRLVRAIRRNTALYVNTEEGRDWLRNVRRNPSVVVKVGRHRQNGVVREVTESAEREAANDRYVNEIAPFEYVTYSARVWSLPTRRKLIEWHRGWVENAVMLAIELDPS
jgi:deazaflavin-dependent oxidoreductase (nitroreductase family)